jgi:galactoside O-acetyltransferase
MTSLPIIIGKHTVVGTNTVVLPGCNIGDYCGIGACSLVTTNISSGKMVKGIPAKEYKDRDYKKIQNLETNFLKGK